MTNNWYTKDISDAGMDYMGYGQDPVTAYRGYVEGRCAIGVLEYACARAGWDMARAHRWMSDAILERGWR